MSEITIGAVLLLVLAVILARIAERLVDWLFPKELNYRIAAALARLAVHLACSEPERQEAQDALANIRAPYEDSLDVSPLAAVAPVFVRSLRAQLSWSFVERSVETGSGGYRHTNSKGATYYLNSKLVTLVGGKGQAIYYFSKNAHPETACQLPPDR